MAMSLQEKQNTGQELYRGSHACCHGQSGIKWKLRGETDQKRKGYPVKRAQSEGKGKSYFFFYFVRALKPGSGVYNGQRRCTHSLASVWYHFILKKFSASGQFIKTLNKHLVWFIVVHSFHHKVKMNLTNDFSSTKITPVSSSILEFNSGRTLHKMNSR